MSELTGLPEVPKTYFWRIKPSYYNSSYLRVELRRKLLWFSYEKDFEFAHDNRYSIIAAAERAVKSNFRSANAHYGHEYHGDYPPKTLKREEK